MAATLALAVAVAVGASIPGASAAKRLPTPKATHFGHNSNRVTNSWFPLARGSVYVYDGQKDGKAARDVMTVTPKVKTIAGIRAAVINDRLFLNGQSGGAHHRLVRPGQARAPSGTWARRPPS